ncbi:energy-coupling factor transporter ATPase [Bifidobacterium avesanii]|uniref:ATP-binding cassette domain-containing protein n=1 Tax=Bifidobacterium avesanii TaxID=1798157 RepID=A0A7K3TG51_9BIFI|nr:energy-coupling factor transporter ATPase [Bifidobacterium avesanii]KAB8295596.1 cobalt ABC transporter [Bifidobacterium avesanii]NEG77600.1 ATP-binding cassette domain-containing protein [Bifidobacterium avesanii]
MTSPAISEADSPAIRLSGIRFRYHDSAAWALDGIDLTVRHGEYVCVVGANGSGKSTLALIMAGLAAPDEGTVELLGHRVFDDAGAHPDEYRAARHGIGMVFQNPEDQIVTTVLADDVAFGPENLGMARPDIVRHVDAALDAVDMAGHAPDDPTRMSGGQQQRSAIAGMLAMDPRLLILDEPTAMLDTVARADIMRILDTLHARGTTIVHITHSPDEAHRGTRVVEIANGHAVGDETIIPMSHGRAAAKDADGADGGSSSLPSDIATDGGATDGTEPTEPTEHAEHADPVIAVRDLSFAYTSGEPVLSGFNLDVRAGETVALVGRNGAGKSTLARLVCALGKPQSGTITVHDIDTVRAGKRERKELRRHVGYVMQHPERQLFADTVREDVAYGPRNQELPADEVNRRVDEALDLLGIAHLADRSPFDLSGGQQRLAAIAGVIACRPDVLVMDEPTASLDARATARIRDLIRTLHARGVTIMLITHAREELALADRVVDLSRSAAPRPEAAAGRRTTGMREMRETHETHERDRADAVSRMDPRVKMALTLLLMFSAFAISDVWQLLAGAALVGAAIAVARINPLRLLGTVHPFLALFAVTGAANVFFVRTGTPVWSFGPVTITDDGLWTMVIYVLRFALVILLGAVFLTRTTPTQMTDAFESLLSPLARLGVHTHELSLVMSLALRFIPTLTGEARAVADAQAARGGGIETGSPMQRARAMGAIVVPVFAGTLRHADNLSRALDARCYEGGSGRTHYRVMAVGARDVAAMLVVAVYLGTLVALAFIR